MSFREYVAHGWALCGIDAGKKAPIYEDWNDPSKALTEEEAEGVDGAGLMHPLSGTCALDVDNIDLARPFLAKHGIDIDALLNAPEAVKISSGRAGRAKLLYKMRFPMRTLKPRDSGIELRSATSEGKSVQDVLPPTIHPLTKKPYTWVYGDKLLAHWSNLPPIPANLLALWRELAAITPLEKGATHTPRIETDRETIRKAMYQRIKRKNLNVSNHEDWLEVGMALHDQTGGAQDGLELWDEWSATDDSLRDDGHPRYQGIEAIKTRYVSFSSPAGKNVVSLAGDVAQLPAEKEEFEVEMEQNEAETTAALMKRNTEEKKAVAQAALEKRLVYVRKLARYFDTERHEIIQSDGDLRHQFASMMPFGRGGVRIDPAAALMNSSTKRSVERLAFNPGEKAVFSFEGLEYANTYRNRLPEPIEPTALELEKIEWAFERIADISYRTWLKQFYAHVVQYPGVKIRSAPLIWSREEGNGKSTVASKIPQLLVGRDYSKELTFDQLNDSFTGFLLDTWHISLKEFRAGSRGERDRITKKMEVWIADDAIPVRAMHQTAFTIPNMCFVTASTNADDAASITNTNRKWGIHEMKAAQMTGKEIRWMYHEFLLKPRAAAVLRYYFMNFPIGDFNPDAPAIVTADRAAMIESSVSPDVEALRIAFEERSGIFSREVVMVQEAQTFIHKSTPSRPSVDRVGKLLAHEFGALCKQVRVGESRYRVAILKNHARWDNSSGKEVMAHIEGLDDDASVEFGPTDEELLA